MRMSKSWKILIALTLVVMAVCSLGACKKDKKEAGPTSIFSNQHENISFYYKQGYPDDWNVSEGEEGKEIRELEGLKNATQRGYYCANFFPKNENSENVSYAIYKFEHGKMMSTLNSIAANLMDPESEYYFNDTFYADKAEGPRKSFSYTSNEYTFNKFHTNDYNYVSYTFVKGGEDWRGTWYVTTGQSTWLYLVVTEAKADVWESVQPTFTDMLNDLAIIGFEDDN